MFDWISELINGIGDAISSALSSTWIGISDSIWGKFMAFIYPSKYYCVDTGLRNARLNFRQLEETHLMENVIFNELSGRGHSVDVGVVETIDGSGEKRMRRTYEIDFVVNAETAGEKYYIQSALNLDTQEKTAQEIRPFLKIRNDFTRRIVITKSTMPAWTDEYGILHLGIYDFLLRKTF